MTTKVDGFDRLVETGAVIDRSSLRLAFVAALQHLSARQRGALILRDVLGQGGTDWCLKAVSANGQPGFAAYRRVGGGYELHTLQNFTVTAEGISRNSVFQDSEVFTSFGLPAGLDAQGRGAGCLTCLGWRIAGPGARPRLSPAWWLCGRGRRR